MEKKGYNIHLAIIAVVLILSGIFGIMTAIKVLSGTMSSQYLSSAITGSYFLTDTTTTGDTTVTPPPVCVYSCTAWSPCSTSGMQYCTNYNKNPDGCQGGTQPTNQTRTCTPPVTVCNFICTQWSSCSSAGVQSCQNYNPQPSGCQGGTIPNLTQTCTPPTTNYPTCAYSYSDWSSCTSSGVQTRTYTKSPDNCVGGTVEPLTKYCTYTPPTTTPPTCSISYSDWSSCTSSGVQARTYTKSPDGCVGGNMDVLSRTCTFIPPTTSNSSSNTLPNCDYIYTEWQPCNAYSKQYRSVISPAPYYCSNVPITSQSCTYNPPSNSTSNTSICSYQYTDWSSCSSSGVQTRSVKAAFPSGCVGGEMETTQKCTYSASSTTTNSTNTSGLASATVPTCRFSYTAWSPCDSNGNQARNIISKSPTDCIGGDIVTQQKCDTASQISTAPVCTFTYSSWGECQPNNAKTRFITSHLPEGCFGGSPATITSCTYVANSSSEESAPVTTPTTEEDIQSSTFIVRTGLPPTPGFNGITTADWQKKYFGSEVCLNKDVCGGGADPDKDGLTNNDEFRIGTNPMDPDADGDGKSDGEEIVSGNDPLKYSKDAEGDKVVMESPKSTGEIQEDVYQVENVEMIDAGDGKKKMKISGFGIPNSYIKIFIYSDSPLVLTVKTDNQGNWSYDLDEPVEDGNHQVYVAVTDNAGKIQAKSEPLPFIKTAQAVTVTKADSANSSLEKAVKSKPGISVTNILLILALAFLAVVVGFVILGVVIKKLASRINLS
jgi:hypothetical protein